MNNTKMDPIFYLTLLAGALTVFLSGITYNKGKKKEAAADLVNQQLMQRTAEVVELQSKLLQEMNKTGEKSDLIITLQNRLDDAGREILRLSKENSKQIIGGGSPALAAHVYPDGLIELQIVNSNSYPFYDLSINFPNPDPTIALKKMTETGANLSWDDMRNQWLHINPFNLPAKSAKSFYRFALPQSLDKSVVFLNIASRHGAFSGRIVIARAGESYTFETEVRDLKGTIVSESKD